MASVERAIKYAQRQAHRVQDRIYQGHVIIEGGDIFGDGVNVAARGLTGISEPGGVR